MRLMAVAHHDTKIHFVDLEAEKNVVGKISTQTKLFYSLDGYFYYHSSLLKAVHSRSRDEFCKTCMNKIGRLSTEDFGNIEYETSGLMEKVEEYLDVPIGDELYCNEIKTIKKEMNPIKEGDAFKRRLTKLSRYLWDQENVVRDKIVKALVEFYEKTGFMVDGIDFEWESDEIENEDVSDRYHEDLTINIHKRD